MARRLSAVQHALHRWEGRDRPAAPRHVEAPDLVSLKRSTDPVDAALLTACKRLHQSLQHRKNWKTLESLTAEGSLIGGTVGSLIIAPIAPWVPFAVLCTCALTNTVAFNSKTRAHESAKACAHKLEQERTQLEEALSHLDIEAEAVAMEKRLNAPVADSASVTQSAQTVCIGSLTLPRRPDTAA